jgi:phage replication-related protein YjqB (UPF0714/DUF867 family)
MPRYEYKPSTSGDPHILICAIHAGVEHGTASIARAVYRVLDPATTGLFVDWNPVHITSTVYHHPVFDIAVRHYDTVISIHGMTGYGHAIFVGGRDEALIRRIRSGLGATVIPPVHLAGEHPSNIVNRGASGAGVQLEIDVSLLRGLPPELFAATLANSIRTR